MAANNGMNAEPPTARFQMEHQPRRPGYARTLSAQVNAPVIDFEFGTSTSLSVEC
jgi:chloramphenicol 3-O-phosphotransferase